MCRTVVHDRQSLPAAAAASPPRISESSGLPGATEGRAVLPPPADGSGATTRVLRRRQGPFRESAVEASELEGFVDLVRWGIRSDPARQPSCKSPLFWRPETWPPLALSRRSCRGTGPA